MREVRRPRRSTEDFARQAGFVFAGSDRVRVSRRSTEDFARQAGFVLVEFDRVPREIEGGLHE